MEAMLRYLNRDPLQSLQSRLGITTLRRHKWNKPLLLGKASQLITFQVIADKVYGDEPFVLNASSFSGLSPAYSSSDPNVASVSSGTVTIHKPGTVTITASHGGNENYNAAPDVGRTFNITKAHQNISFTSPSPQRIDAGSFTLNATSSAGLPVTFSALSTMISIHQNTATPLSLGKAVVQASRNGNDFYFAANPVVHSFCIDPLKPSLVMETTSEGYLLISDHTSENHNRWYLNETLIPNETSNTLTATTAGLYTTWR